MCILASENVELFLKLVNCISKLHWPLKKRINPWEWAFLISEINKCLQYSIQALLLEKSVRLCMCFTQDSGAEHADSFFVCYKMVLCRGPVHLTCTWTA